MERRFDPAKIADYHFNDLFQYLHKFRDRLIIVLSIFSTASVLFAGSVYFKRFALVKTLIVFGFAFGISSLLFIVFSRIFSTGQTSNPGYDVHLHTYEVMKDMNNVELAAYLLGGLSWIFFLALAYFKLKEKEV